ncbi:MAG: LpxI family protein [Rhizobiaceae bacterium]
MPNSEPAIAPRFGPGSRVAVIAGSGRLPVDVAEALAQQGREPFILKVEGEVDREADFARFDQASIRLEEVGLLPAVFRRHGITHVVLAGGIARRPALRRLKPTLALLRVIPTVIAGLAGGDNKVLSALIRCMKVWGVEVVGVHEIVPELLAPVGPIARTQPLESDRRDLAAAFAAAKAIGGLDVGQAAIAIGGRAVELEGIDGTAGLLERTKSVRSHGRLAGRARGVLVKAAKPDQELRADLPSIGPDTVDAAHAAGLAGIGLEAGMALILESAETVARADRLGLFIVGLGPDGR